MEAAETDTMINDGIAGGDATDAVTGAATAADLLLRVQTSVLYMDASYNGMMGWIGNSDEQETTVRL